jgi:hypothetical protein
VRITHISRKYRRASFSNFKTSLAVPKEKWGGDPKPGDGFRRVLDESRTSTDNDARRNHWHALMTILACQAVKDV